MKMRIFLIALGSLLTLIAKAQFPFYTVFPLSVSNIYFGDTLLMPRSILQGEGIKKIIAAQVTTGSPVQFVSFYSIEDGKIIAKKLCLVKNGDTTYSSVDSIRYDHQGRMVEYMARDGANKVYTKATASYKENGHQVITWTHDLSHNEFPDTIVHHYWYNAKGQLTRQEQPAVMPMPVNATLFYNEAGLLDRVQHDRKDWETFVFIRKPHKKGMMMVLEKKSAIYTWYYSHEGRWISSHQKDKKKMRRGNQPPILYYKDNYYSYNDNGTLSRVIEKSNNRIVTTTYSYEK